MGYRASFGDGTRRDGAASAEGPTQAVGQRQIRLVRPLREASAADCLPQASKGSVPMPLLPLRLHPNPRAAPRDP